MTVARTETENIKKVLNKAIETFFSKHQDATDLNIPVLRLFAKIGCSNTVFYRSLWQVYERNKSKMAIGRGFITLKNGILE